ncbi:MAG: hypothetical protein MUC50_10005 [Myxococcota bacterium]|nr:hypothetical protein [Myxococcota bacterium]
MLSNPSKRAAYDAQLRGRGVDTSPVETVRKVPIPLVSVLIAVLGIFLGLRFVRNVRSLLVLAAVIALAWFGPRLVTKFRSGKRG